MSFWDQFDQKWPKCTNFQNLLNFIYYPIFMHFFRGKNIHLNEIYFRLSTEFRHLPFSLIDQTNRNGLFKFFIQLAILIFFLCKIFIFFSQLRKWVIIIFIEKGPKETKFRNLTYLEVIHINITYIFHLIFFSSLWIDIIKKTSHSTSRFPLLDLVSQ